MTQPAVLKHLRQGRECLGDNKGRGNQVFGTKRTYYLPHQSVIIICFHLAGVDQFSLERSEASPFEDAAVVGEDSTMGDVSPGRLEDGQPCNTEPNQGSHISLPKMISNMIIVRYEPV